MNRPTGSAMWLAVMLAGATVAAPGVLSAQGGDGFLSNQPNISLKFESGYGWQAASSDVYDWVRQEHTIGQRDFDAPYFGGGLGLGLSEHLELAIAIGYQSGKVTSEYRDWVEDVVRIRSDGGELFFSWGFDPITGRGV